MHLNSAPTEVLDLIIGHLVETTDGETGEENYEHISNSRLVCRLWNKLATPHRFRTVTLKRGERPSPGEGAEFKAWHKRLNREVVRRAAQQVVIHSVRSDMYEGGDYDTWNQWEEEGEYQALTDAIGRIAELPNLRSLQLSFSEHCQGPESDSPLDDVEPEWTRQNTLLEVLKALRDRRWRGDALRAEGGPAGGSYSAVRSLTLLNLQNVPIPDITGSALFREVLGDVERLHLMVAEECCEPGPDHDLECPERHTYEPYLQRELLPSVAANLTHLTLFFRECWGVVPGNFDGRGLSFPRLSALALGSYVVAHQDQFDWVLRQTTLRSLRLDGCYVASHLRAGERQLAEWGVRTDGWERQPRGAFGFTRDEDAVYTFDGTWAGAVLDGVRTRLTGLVDFRLDERGAYREHGNHFFRADLPGPARQWEGRLSGRRYITFDAGLLPSPWIKADEATGRMHFGNNSPAIVEQRHGVNRYRAVAELNRADETREEDSRALVALFDAIKERCRT